MSRPAFRTSVPVIFVIAFVWLPAAAHAQVLPAPNPAPRPTPHAVGPVSTAPFRHPTTRPVIRGFDLRNGPYGSGNRGLDYGVSAGDRITAIGAGVVVFAGLVAGERFVTVLHPNGLRSSYSYLADLAVDTGDRVGVGQVLGSSSGRFQLGIRRGEEYLDPAPLLGRAGPPARARLVAVRRV